MDLLIPLIILLVAGLSAFLVSKKTLSMLRKHENKYAMHWSVATFILTMALVFVTIVVIILANMDFGR